MGALHAPLRDVRRRGPPIGRLEEPLEMELAEPRDRGQRGQVEWLGVVPICEIPRPAQMDEHITGRPQLAGHNVLLSDIPWDLRNRAGQ